MAYSVDTFSGGRTIVVEDGTIDSSLDIRLVGKNYAGYGEVQNENFLHLLENFAGISAPPKPINGQIWFDSSSRKLKFWDSSTAQWRTNGAVESRSSAPTGAAVGDLWWDEVNKQLYAYDGTTFTLIGPQGLSGLGTTEMKSLSVTDFSGGIHAIIAAYSGGEVLYVISKDNFLLSTTSQTLLGGSSSFDTIHSGITLTNSTGASGETTGTTLTNGRIFWGTASNALQLEGHPAEDFYLKAETDLDVFTTQVSFADVGYVLGDQSDLLVRIDSDGTTPLIRNQVGNTVKFQTTVAGQGVKTPLQLVNNTVLPGQDAVTDLGSTVLKFNNLYAVNLYGNGTNLTNVPSTSLTGTIPSARLSGTYNINISGTASSATNADTLKSGSVYVEARVDTAATGTPNTVAVRDIDGNLNAVFFQGTATSALFADLAEKYLTDQEYEIGTVVSVGGEAEVTACKHGDRAFGAVSGSPAFMMNQGLEGGTYIALKGRVPIKVVGPIKKGDKLVAAGNGCAGNSTIYLRNMAISAGGFPDTFAIALESNDSPDVKLVEAVIL
jgi:hypothetical protein